MSNDPERSHVIGQQSRTSQDASRVNCRREDLRAAHDAVLSSPLGSRRERLRNELSTIIRVALCSHSASWCAAYRNLRG